MNELIMFVFCVIGLLFLGGVFYLIYKVFSLLYKFIFGVQNELDNTSSNFTVKDSRIVVNTYVAMAKLTPKYGVDKKVTNLICDYSKSAFKAIAFADNSFAPIDGMMKEFHKNSHISVRDLRNELASFETKGFSFKKEFLMGLFSIAYLNGDFDGERENLIDIVKESIGMSDSDYKKVRMLWSRKMLGKIRNLQDLERRRAEWYERESQKESEQDNHDRGQDYRHDDEEYDYDDRTTDRPHLSAELEKAYSVLGLSPDASVYDIKKMKRELLKKYHPDLYTGKGERAVEEATLKSQEINQAFEMIMKIKN